MEDYRDSHSRPDQAAWYEHGVYDETSYDSWVWTHEQRYLHDLLGRYFRGRDVRLLDFACGTGRILSFLEGHVAEATGIDISDAMLRIARSKVRNAVLIKGDITTGADLLDGPYDLITAFRFFLNAQERLRGRVLTRLRETLADDGLLVFNIHGNSWSLRRPAYAIRRHVGREKIEQMSFREVRRLLGAHGLEIVDVEGIGLLTRRLRQLVGPRRAEALERLPVRYRPLRYFAVDLVFAARPKSG